jgi:hypothetical protein
MISTKIVRIVKITGVILAALTFVGLMEDRIEFEKQKEIMGGHHIPAQSYGHHPHRARFFIL